MMTLKLTYGCVSKLLFVCVYMMNKLQVYKPISALEKLHNNVN